MGRVAGQGWVTVVTMATALTPAPGSVVSAVVANPAAGAAGGEPHPLGEVAAVGVTLALAPWSDGGGSEGR